MDKRCDSCFELFDSQFDVCPHCGYVDGTPAKEIYHLYPGTRVNNRYIIGEVLGFGGFGITYKVWDTELETVLAIKEYYPSGLVNRVPGTSKVVLYTGNKLAEYKNGLVRFLDEARHTAQFNSEKNIIHVFDYFEENGTAYFVMEYLEGMSLKAYFESICGKMSVDEAVNIAVCICSALKKVHETGYIHRDVSADNIYICSNNRIVLYDFGAARFSTGEEKTMSIILKPGYAPPEQYRAKSKQGPWTDIYALGATVYNLITGVPPEESINRTIEDTLIPPSEVDESIPQYLSDTIMKAMAINYNLRFENVQEFQDALEQNKKVIPIDVELKKRKKKRAISLIAASIVLCFAGFFCWNLWREPALKPATLSVFISIDEDEELAKEKEAAYQRIFDSFTEINDKIAINITTIEEKYYAEEIEHYISVGEAPALFESTGLDDKVIEECQILDGVFEQAEPTEYYFLDSYNVLFPQMRQLPMGFSAPAVYINTTMVTKPPQIVADAKAIYGIFAKSPQISLRNNQSESFLVTMLGCSYSSGEVTNVDAVSDLFGKIAAPSDSAIEDFLPIKDEQGKTHDYSGKNAVLYASTSDYYAVRDALPQRYRVYIPDSRVVLGQFTDLWSMGAEKDDEKKAAERLLLFMLSDAAQDYLHIQRRSKAIPLNKNAAAVWFELNPELSSVADRTKKMGFITE